MMPRTPRSPSARNSLGRLTMAVFVLFSLLGVVWISSPAQKITINPMSGWTPVVTEFYIPENPYRHAQLEPAYVPLQPRIPSLVAAWEILQPMVRIRLSGSLWNEDEPVISGWKPYLSENGESSLQVMRSDMPPEDGLPVRNVLKQSRCWVSWKIEIWGEGGKFYRLPENPKLRPGDPEYQDLIKKKIVVRDYSFRIYKIPGDMTKIKTLKNRIEMDPYWVPDPEYSGEKPLSDYESNARNDLFTPIPGFFEAQLKMKLYFPEVDDRQATTEETEVEASMRFLCLGVEFREIGRTSQFFRDR